MNRKPTVNNRASIAQWSIEISFLTKWQISHVIQKMLEDDIPWHFEYWQQYDSEEKMEKFYLAIDGMSWATNLSRLAKWLEEIDYFLDLQ